MTITQYMVSTSDNPFNPFTEFDDWYRFDEIEKHYCTLGLMARYSVCSTDAPEKVATDSDKRACGIILSQIPLNSDTAHYILVTHEAELDEAGDEIVKQA